MQKIWYIFVDDHHTGPFSMDDVLDKYDLGELGAYDLLWREGQDDWEYIKDIGDFSHLFQIPGLPEEDPEKKSSNPIPPLPEHLQSQEELKELDEAFDGVEEEPVQAVQKEEPELKEAEKKVEKEKAPKPKKSFLPLLSRVLSLPLAFIAVFFIILPLVYIVTSGGGEYFKGLRDHDKQRLEAILKNQSPDEKFELALTEKRKNIWLASNFNERGRIYLSLISKNERVLSEVPIHVTSSADFVNSRSYFNILEFVQGEKLVSGYYDFEITWVNEEKEKFTHRGEVLFSPRMTKIDFELALERFNKKIRRKKIGPLQKAKESLATYQNLLGQIQKKYTSVILKLKNPKKISLFQTYYSNEPGRFIQTLVLDNIGENERYIVEPGKKIMALCAQTITQVKNLKRLNKRKRKWLKAQFENNINLISEEIDILKQEIDREIQTLN